MSRRLKVLLVLAVLLGGAGLIVNSLLFKVSETEMVFLVENGKAVEVITEPGYRLRSWGQELVRYQTTPIALRPPAETLLTTDQKPILVDSLAHYRILDPMRFFELDQEKDMDAFLAKIVNATLRRELGYVKSGSLRSDVPGAVEQPLAEKANTNAKRFGVEFVDILVRCADPERCQEQKDDDASG